MNAVLTNESQQEKQHSEGIGFQLWGHGPLEDRAKAEQILLAMFFTSQTHIYKKKRTWLGWWRMASGPLLQPGCRHRWYTGRWEKLPGNLAQRIFLEPLWLTHSGPIYNYILSGSVDYSERGGGKKKSKSSFACFVKSETQTRIMQLKKEVVQ